MKITKEDLKKLIKLASSRVFYRIYDSDTVEDSEEIKFAVKCLLEKQDKPESEPKINISNKPFAETFIEFYVNTKPRIIWEMDAVSFQKIKIMKDHNLKYLWMPDPDHSTINGTLMGFQINVVSKEKGIRLRYQFNDEKFTNVKFKLEGIE